jgi:hypothetical protein
MRSRTKAGRSWVGIAVSLAVMAVASSGHASAAAGRYTVSSGTVLDNETGMTWQQTISGGAYTWSAAQSFCASLNLNGTGWRVPSVKELMTLVDFSVVPGSGSATIDATAFPSTPANYFWSSSIYALDSSSAWLVYFYGGGTNVLDVSGTYGVRCVR